MYFQNSSYVIDCSTDAFEDVWCMCECMMYVMICDACLDVWWMSKCMLYIYKYDACKMYACQWFFYASELENDAQKYKLIKQLCKKVLGIHLLFF